MAETVINANLPKFTFLIGSDMRTQYMRNFSLALLGLVGCLLGGCGNDQVEQAQKPESGEPQELHWGNTPRALTGLDLSAADLEFQIIGPSFPVELDARRQAGVHIGRMPLVQAEAPYATVAWLSGTMDERTAAFWKEKRESEHLDLGPQHLYLAGRVDGLIQEYDKLVVEGGELVEGTATYDVIFYDIEQKFDRSPDSVVFFRLEVPETAHRVMIRFHQRNT